MSTPPSSQALQSAQTWLEAPLAPDPLDDLPELRALLRVLNQGEATGLQLLKLLERLEPRANALSGALKPMLLDAGLPLSSGLRDTAETLLDMHGTLAECYEQLAQEARPERSALAKGDVPLLCAYGLHNLVRQFETSLLVSAPSPAEMWSRALSLHYLMRLPFAPEQTLPRSTALADRLIKEMLALAAAQPEGQTPRETGFLARFLARYAAAVEISPEPPESAHDWFWLKDGHDRLPMALVRRPPPAAGRLLFFSCTRLGQNTLEVMAKLTEGTPPESLKLPTEASLPAYLDVLKRAQARWGMPSRRQFARRYTNRRVSLCTNPGALWQRLHCEGSDDAISEWMVFNEGPEGFAVMHVTGPITGLVTGSALGLRFEPEQPWSICIVRWARSDNSEHVEIGLELVAAQAQPVHVAAHGAPPGESPAAALLLPPLPRLNRGEALLTTRGRHRQGRFSIIHEQPRLRISECEPGTLAVQTSSIEIFEFTRDPLRLS